MKKDHKKIICLIIILIIAMVLSTYFVKKVYNKQANLSPEILRSMNYKQITDEDSKVENTDFVKFSAFFTRDLNGDGNAEKLLGTCRNISSTDQLYIDLNVLTNGYLKDGVITINSTNFTYSMSMVKDSVLKNNYISDDVKRIELNQINAGTQKLIIGNVLAYIGDDINNYSNVSSITLTGTHVSDEGIETPISKTVDLTVDWYGTTKTSLYMNYQATTFTYYYDDLDTTTISFNFRLDELQKELILKENVATVSIPELNGYAPTEVKCTNSNVESNYNSETKVLELKRSSTCNENGIVTSSLSRSNVYTINVTYPQEAYEQITGYKQLTIPVTGYYTGYNNVNKEFTNPYKSNEVNSSVTLIFKSKPTDKIYNFSVDFMDKTRVSKPDYRYVVSKQDILNYYDNEDEVKNKEYVVRWLATRGSAGEVPSMIMSETKNGNTYGDKWDSTIMQDYVINTGIYFENANQMLEEDGAISVYNDETNTLIHTFTKEEWNKYNRNNPYKYEDPIRHIRIETTKTNFNSTLGVYNIKELEVSKILEDFTKDQVKDINIIYTYLTGVCNIVGQDAGIINDVDYANYVSEKSDAEISVSSNKLSTQETIENQKIYIRTVYSQVGDAKWKNGEFLVEMPKEIANMEINNISASNDVKIIAYDLFEQDGKYFIKIITENENTTTYTITIDCNMTPDPRTPTTDKEIKLYSYNQNCNDYYFETKDIYDVDSDNNTQEKVGRSNTRLNLISPTSLITLETVSNYNDKNETTVAPNVAAIEKETRNATINVSFTNNYTNTVSGIQILGKIPFEGNTYILNGKDLKSKFTTTMTNAGITIPQELQGKAQIYYSENENPTKDLLDENNGWKLKEKVQDFSKIKTYFIDLKESSIEIGKGYTFTYTVNVPENLDYNLASYSNHTVYYELNTEGGKLSLSTEPNKVGIRVSRKIDFELTKYKEGTENLVVPGATYTLEVSEDEETIKTRILTTNNEGKIQVKDIYVGLKYTVKELRSPSEYKLSDEVIEFTVVEENGNLRLESESDNIVIDEINNIVRIKVEDEPKYNLNITKIDESTKEPIERIVFSAGGNNGITNRNGIATIEKLELNKQYTLIEQKSDDYYKLEDINFKLVKDENGNLKMESENEIFKNAIIENNDTEDLINVSLTLTNEKIPTYNLQMLKVKENFDETDIEKLEPLKGAKFRLTSEDDINKDVIYTTGEDGIINIYNLYQFVEGKYITGNYTLQEVQAPDGYANNAEEIKFRASKNADNALEIEIQEKDKLETIKDIIIEDDTIKVIIQDKPLFKLTKIDATTGLPLTNAKFVIYELDEEGHELGYAKDVNGNYVGELDENGQYIITTDQNGTIILPLKGGLYKAVEVEFPEGYEEGIVEEIFKVEGNGKETEGENVIEINSIEDLVDLSESVNSGNTYENTIVKLTKTLDFNQQSSYKNYKDTSYGDLNGDRNSQTIMEELTDKNGIGFTPIGANNYFSGIFDGQEYEIRNLYINSNNYYAGLFGNVRHGIIRDVGVTGSVSSNRSAGGIIGKSTGSEIRNCYNTGDISTEYQAGGIVGEASDGIIRNCYNTGNISAEYGAGGIVGDDIHEIIKNCYNTGKIRSVKSNAGGIVGNGFSGRTIENCYNIGDISAKFNAGAIVANSESTNSFYLDTIKVYGGSINTDAVPKTEEYMKTEQFVKDLKDEFWSMDRNNINNGLPILLKDEQKGYILEINYIEDLVEFSKAVDTGNTYFRENVILTRTLDFKDITSYKDYQSTSYGDLNENGKVETIMEELTNRDGKGFSPIGGNESDYNNNYFSGTFDGQGYEIKNLYINTTNSYAGLFGIVNNAVIKNIGVTGSVLCNTYDAYAGGIAGNIRFSSISNCYNKMYILANGSGGNCAYVGGIAGNIGSSSISNCYNTGNVNSYKGTYMGTGGIVGYSEGSSIINSYNTGEIYSKTEWSNGRVGGIAGDATNNTGVTTNIINCYNLGNLIGDCAAGIVSGYGNCDIVNCYSAGNVFGDKYSGGIIDYNSYYNKKNITNSYYLENTDVIYTNTEGIAISNEDMISKEFYNTLNVDNVWEYRPTKYPVLFTMPANVREATEITIENSMKEFEITTEIGINSESKRVGGTISGEYRSENINFVESVQYKKDSTQEIKVKADDDYHIVKILINDEEVDFSQTGDREFALPEGHFKEVTEDKHIVVIFEKIDNFIINKVDEEDSNKKLEGAKFTIEKQISPNELMLETKSNSSYPFYLSGNMPYYSTNNGISNSISSSYVPIDLRGYDGKFVLSATAYISSEKNYDFGYATVTENTTTPAYNDTTNRFIYISGEVSSNTYTKELDGGKLYYLHVGYRKDGSGNTGSDRFTIYNIKLVTNDNTPIYKQDSILTTDSEGRIATRFENNLNYRITETQAPVGYALKSETQTIQIQDSEVKELTFTNKEEQETAIITKVDKETNEPIPNTKFSIYNMSNTFETIDFAKDSSGQYMGELCDGIYTVKTDKNGQIRLSLPDGYYKAVEVETAEGYIFEEDETKRTTYFKIGNVTSDFDDRYLTDKEITITNTKKSENNITIKKIDSGTKQKLAGARFRLQNTSSKNNLIGAMVSNSQYSFVKNGTQYYSNNKGIHDSVANAYFPIDLRQYVGTFNLSVNYTISSQSGNDYGYATITTSEDIPTYDQSSGNINTSYRFIYTSGSYSNSTSSISLTGGKKYYLHIGYRKNASTNTGNDTFYINNINLTYSTEVETNSEGIVSTRAPIGNYNITEIKEPLGYELNSTSQTIEISDPMQTYELTFENIKQQSNFNRPNFVLTKKDKVTNNVMPGVKFMILDENDNYVKDYTGTIVGDKEEINGEEKYVVTTDENGQVKLKLKIGKYKLVEVQTYEGYVIDDEKKFEITNENIDYELSCQGEIISTHYPWKNYIRATSDGGIIQTNYGTNKTIPAEKIADNKEIQVVSDKGYVVKYNNNGKIEELIQIDGFQYGTEVYEDSDGNYLVLGSGTKIEIPAERTVDGKDITLSYIGTSSRTIILKLNKDLKVIWARKIDSFYPTSTSINYISENENGDYIINLANYSGNSIIIPAEDTIDGQEINLSRNNGCAFFEYTKDGKVKSIHQISPTIYSLVKKENGGFIVSSGSYIYELDSGMSIVKQYSNNISGISTGSSYSTWVTKDEGFVVGGILTNNSVTISGDNTASGEEIQITSDTLADAVLIKYNKDFKIEWIKVNSWTSGPGESITSVRQDQLGNYIALLRINSNPTQYKLLKYDTNGNIISEIELPNSLMTTDYLYTDNNNTQFIILDGSQNKFLNYKLGVQDFSTIDINMTNQKAGKVIVHHYLEGTGPEYGTDPVTFEDAPDEILTGKVPDEYITSPNMKIKDYTLVKDENNEYIIPNNASGNFTEEDQHVYYYYNEKQLELTVHHYIEGTENRVPLGKNEQGEDIVAEDEHEYYKEGSHYKTTPSEEVLQKYELVEVVGDEEKDITQDEVVTYYYRIKKHEITTKVEIPEGRTEEEKGGQILGEGESPYETVDHEKSSTKDIIITPDDGYRVKQIRLVSTNEEGQKTESIIYGENATENTEVTYEQDKYGVVKLTKFDKVTEDKEVIVVFEPYEGRLIIHHYIEGTTEKIYDDQITIKPVGTEVETAPVKVGNLVVVEEPEGRKAIITEETQEKTYYYQKQYKITTEVIKHKESYKDGTTMNDVRGGQIEDEGKEAHELVLKNRSNQEKIEVIPDPGYEIVSIIIKDGQEAKDGINIDFDQYKEKDENGKKTGKVILPVGLFPSMQSDKHIQVEFRKKTNIIVKHLEEGTEDVLYQTEQGKDYEELKGYESQEFETSRKVIPNYMAAEVEVIENTSEGEGHVSKAGITNENKEHMTKYNKVQTDEKTYVNGEMYADTLTIVYWYTRVPSGIIVRHIETNEKAEEKEIESKLVDGLAGLEQPTTRNKYDKYISVDRKEENKGSTNENVTVMSKDQNSKTLTFAENETLEVWYFYEKEYNVTTEVKPHEEKVLNEETKEYETVLKDGGTISKRYEKDEQGNDKLDDKGNKIETVYEKILSRGDSKEEIEVKPDDGYRIKTVIKQKKVIVNGKETSEDEKVFIENMIKEDGSVILPEGQLTDVQNDYNIVVEFERIPAKVIVEYKDAYTKETIHEDKEIPGFVNDKYNESRIEIESYIPANPEPENSEGKMTEETITVTYWYTKQFKITAKVKPHEEEDQNPETGETMVVQKDGGTIKIGEDLPEEIVTRGKSSTQKIIAEPEDNYQIKEVTINGKKIAISNLIKEDGTLELPLFENMQEDKHIVVEFERIPAKVIVEHLDEETNEPIVDEEIVDGYINKNYETNSKDIKYYKLVEEKYPENYKGTMTEEDIVVKYYYKKLGFNMKIEKVIQGIKLNGQETGIDLQNHKFAKLEVEYKEIENTNIEISYNIKVTNTEKISGTAIVEEIIPDGFEFLLEDSDNNWKQEEEKFILETEEIGPGEVKEYKVVLRWNPKAENRGKKINTVKISEVNNEPGYGEITLEDNEDTAIIEIKINKTIQEIINDAKENIKDGNIDNAIKGTISDIKYKVKDVKTGDAIIVSIITLLIAGVTILIIIKRKKTIE